MTHLWIPIGLMAAPLFWATPIWAIPLASEQVPLPRLLRNLQSYVDNHPGDAEAHYLLGRVHASAFLFGVSVEVLVAAPYRDETASDERVYLSSRGPSLHTRPTDAELGATDRVHLYAAIERYEHAIRLSRNRRVTYNRRFGELVVPPNKSLAYLGLGWILEQGSRFSMHLEPPRPREARSNQRRVVDRDRFARLLRRVGPTPGGTEAEREIQRNISDALEAVLAGRRDRSADVRRASEKLLQYYWIQQALEAYRACYQLTGKQPSEDPHGRLGPGLEAAEAIVRILRERIPDGEPGAFVRMLGGPLSRSLGLDPSGVERAELAKLEEELAKPRSFSISPIIFSVGENESFEDLVRPDVVVSFDLDGSDLPQLWPWVGASTGILVWDPSGEGKITSGRQLFGSVTWWMFWSDGYQPLTALDDDRSGWLEGSELDGLSVWVDQNANGVSDPSEVVPAADWDIVRIGVKPDSTVGPMPWHSVGVEFADDRSVPSYDWMPTRGGL